MAPIAVIALASLLIGLSKGGMGAVLIVIVTPLLSLVMPVAQAVSLALPLLLIGDVFAIWLYWRRWDMHYVKLMLPSAVAGIVVGTALLATLPDHILRVILGLLTLAFVIYRLIDARLKSATYVAQPWHGYAAGAASGLGSALANTGAPPFTAYMLLQPIEPIVFVGTTTLFFAAVNALKLPGLIVAGLFDLNDLLRAAWALPLIPIGVWCGRWLVRRLNRTGFERFMLGVLGLAGLILILVPPR